MHCFINFLVCILLYISIMATLCIPISLASTNSTVIENKEQIQLAPVTVVPLHSAENNYTPSETAIKWAEPLLSLAQTTITLDLSATLDPAWEPLITKLSQDGFDQTRVMEVFAKLGTSSYSPAFMGAKITELYGVKGIAIDEAEEDEQQLPEGYEQPIPEVTVREYKSFSDKYKDVLQDIQKTHGVGKSIIVALLLIETGLGSDLGDTPALRALASMAATDTPARLAEEGNTAQTKRLNPTRVAATLKTKSDWAYAELKALLIYGEKNNIDVSKIPGSVYGAIGICQFMPSNIEPYGIDGDKNGKVDLFSVVDAMYSAAFYLEQHGWRGAKTAAEKFRVLRTYNQDSIYAANVLGTSNQLILADKGKVAAGKNPVVSLPSRGKYTGLGKKRYIPPKARIKSLGNYSGILENTN